MSYVLPRFQFSSLFRIREDIDCAPDQAGGLYSIVFRFPTSFELGFTGGPVDLENVMKTIISKIEIIFQLSRLGKAEGLISDNIYGTHLRTDYHVAFEKIVSGSLHDFITEIKSLDLKEDTVIDLIDVLGLAVGELPPIYIGIANKQSIRDRLRQHRSGESTLSKRFLEEQLFWGDFGFKFLIVPKNRIRHLRRYEKIVQSITLPVLSRL